MTNTITTDANRLGGLVSRSMRKVTNRLGVVKVENDAHRVKKVRDERLELYDKYHEGSQYDELMGWEESNLQGGGHVPVRKRKPRIIYNFTKLLTDRIASKLVGNNVFPSFTIEDDPDSEEFVRAVVKASRLKHRIIDPIKKMGVSGSVFVRFMVEAGSIRIEHYSAKHVYPEFQSNGELEAVRIQFVYTDKDDIDESGKPKEKWFRLDLGMFKDILYDNPDYRPNVPPSFGVVSEVPHQLGFVQGEWFRTSVRQDTPDGYSLIGDILGFIDELNYSLSQSSTAVSYNQDPQLVFKGMDEDEVATLIRSSTKGWNVGREGEASFLESTLNGVQMASDLRDRVRLNIQDIARVIMLDPEKMVGHAQSGKAMEVLHGPLVELINELRPLVEERLTALIQKMGVTLLVVAKQGMPLPIQIPPGYTPKSLNLVANWPPIFPMTTQDLKERVAWISSATNASIISRETGMKILAKDFGIEDVEEELAKINAQPVLNPFGSF